MTTYAEHIKKNSSKKVVTAWFQPTQQLVLWNEVTSPVYSRSVNYFVVGLFENGQALTQVYSQSLASGEFYYNPLTNVLYIRTTDDSDPVTKKIKVEYRLFFSNTPTILPYDLESGTQVEYQPRLKSNSPIKKELDDEQIGLAIESNTTFSLQNADGFFDPIFDTLFWEYSTCESYSLVPNNTSEKRRLFKGVVQNKKFSKDSVRFSAKDFMFKLRQPVILENYQDSDGSVPDNILNTPKPRLYGQFDGHKCKPIDAILDGYTLSGTVTGAIGGVTLTGVGTSFLDECSPNDVLKLIINNELVEYTVDSVETDISLTVSDEIEIGFSGQTITNEPERPWRKKNRNWHIAGHKLREPTTSITEVISLNRFKVLSTVDMFEGDLIDINGQDLFIKRIINNEIVLRTNYQGGLPSVSDVVTKNSVSAAYASTKEIFINRDWTISNGSSDSIINLTDLAEFNISKLRINRGSYTFTNGSRDVTITGADAENILQPRDWIRSTDITHTDWYEVLAVDEDEIKLRTPYQGGNFTGTSNRKNPDLINDKSLITVNTLGLERGGVWVKTASDAVLDIIENDATITDIDTQSFSEADSEAPYILSLKLPVDGNTAPKIKDVITLINTSVFGSLINNSNWDLVYNILSPEKPEDLEEITDSDLTSNEPTYNTKTEIYKKVNAQYAPFTDRFSTDDSFKLYEFENDFVTNFIDSEEELDLKLFLYRLSDVETIAQRYALYNSLTQSDVTIQTKLQLSDKNLNDKVYINIRSLYDRFGNADKRKIGIVRSITKDGRDTIVSLNDLGNIFNRVMSITSSTAPEFSSSGDSNRITDCYIVDNDTELPDSSTEKYNNVNIIG